MTIYTAENALPKDQPERWIAWEAEIDCNPQWTDRDNVALWAFHCFGKMPVLLTSAQDGDAGSTDR